MLHSLDEIPQTLHAQPEGFDAGFAIAFAAEESATFGNQADELTQLRGFLGMGFLSRM